MTNKRRTSLGKNFILLWQGQLVSGIGDALYSIALSFFVLQKTGSTALMGAMLACGLLPGILLSPFAGALADRSNRRNLIIWMDVIRGILVIAAGALAYLNILEIWYLFIVAVGLGVCSTLFSPTVNALLPDITPRERLMQANSMMGYNEGVQQILGGPIGGLLYTALGAPILFLGNGISYLISALSERFIDPTPAPKQEHGLEMGRLAALIKDVKAGVAYVWKRRGMRSLMLFAFFSNFFGQATLFLIPAFFYRRAELGVGRYGFAVAAMAIGAGAGMLITTFVKIKEKDRPYVFGGFFMLTCIGFGTMMLLDFSYLIVLAAIGAMGAAVFNILLKTAFQQSTPSHLRGKVFSLMGMGINGLVPLAWLLSGVVAEFVAIPIIAAVSCGMSFIMLVAAMLNAPLRDFLAVRGHEASEVEKAQ